MSTTTARKPNIGKLVKDIERTRLKLGYYRDRLRAAQDELEALLEPTEQGLETLQMAIDQLSEQA